MKPAGELTGAGWRIVFVRSGDRIAHHVELADGDQREPLLVSIEGSPDEPSPASPPLQQVHFQPLPGGGQAALLVGMAGRSHWSAAVEVPADGRQAAFEIACRAVAPPAWLGSSYRLESKLTVEYSPTSVWLGPLELAIEPLGQAAAPTWTLGQQVLQLAVSPPAGRWPQTIIWRYALRCRT
ncbi:MAG TPA: hypothetical protein VIK18_12390 [Pirellulales bacterium]